MFDDTFQFIPASTPEEASRKIQKIYRKEVLQRNGSLEEVQVMSPLRKDTEAVSYTHLLALDNFRKKNASKRADTHMMDICGEVEKLENTIKDYVEEDIKKKEILNILEKFLSDLKAGDRDIFVRRYWYMDNIKDIAKRHGCSETKSKSSLFRSRNRLWEEVKEII